MHVSDFGLTGSSPYIFHVGNDLTWKRILMTHVSEHFFRDFFFLLKRDMFLTQQKRKDNFEKKLLPIKNRKGERIFWF